jgi:hypothetical protein
MHIVQRIARYTWLPQQSQLSENSTRPAGGSELRGTWWPRTVDAVRHLVRSLRSHPFGPDSCFPHRGRILLVLLWFSDHIRLLCSRAPPKLSPSLLPSVSLSPSPSDTPLPPSADHFMRTLSSPFIFRPARTFPRTHYALAPPHPVTPCFLHLFCPPLPPAPLVHSVLDTRHLASTSSPRESEAFWGGSEFWRWLIFRGLEEVIKAY